MSPNFRRKKFSGFTVTLVFFAGLAVLLFFAGRFIKEKLPAVSFFANKSLALLPSNLKNFGGVLLRPSAVLSENEQLRRRNNELEADLAQMHVFRQENNFLRSQFNLIKEYKKSFVEAHLITGGSNIGFSSARVDVGSAYGVEQNASVVAENNFLVGRLIDVKDYYAQVLLISDQSSRVAAITSDDLSGIIIGQSHGPLLLDLVPAGDILHEGAIVVTSGIDGLYLPGLPIGKITKIISKESDPYQRALVSPFVDFDRVQRVLLILTRPFPSK